MRRRAPGPTPSPAAGARSRPGPGRPLPRPPADGVDLAVADVSDPPAAAREGAQFSVTETTVNGGQRGRAAASAVRFYLSPDSEQSLQERRGGTAHGAARRAAWAASRDAGRAGRAGRAARRRRWSRSRSARSPAATTCSRAPTTARAVAEAAEGDNCRVATHPENGVEVPTPIQILAEDREYRVDAFSDIFDQPDEADDVADVRQYSPIFCNNQLQPTVSMLPAALASVHAFLAEHAPNGQALFVATAAYNDADPRAGGRGRRDTMGRPGAALAALVRAHELDRPRPRTSSTRPRSPPASACPRRRWRCSTPPSASTTPTGRRWASAATRSR